MTNILMINAISMQDINNITLLESTTSQQVILVYNGLDNWPVLDSWTE